jgi:hypothetical protein
LAAGQLWVTPDSAGYLTLAIAAAERGELSDPLLLFRLPGYPLLLAGVFCVFGEASPVALRVVQHAMFVACVCLTVLIAHRLSVRRFWLVFVGVIAALNPYLSAYADAVLTEVPYTLFLLLWCYLMLRHWAEGSAWTVVAASFTAAGLTMLKDAGPFVLLMTAAVAILVAARGIYAFRQSAARSKLPQAGRAMVYATVPAGIVLLPLLWHYHGTFGQFGLNCNRGMLPYYRAACVDRLDAPDSAALARVKRDLRAAQAAGVVGADATIHDYLPIVRAVQYACDPTSRQIFASRALPEVAKALSHAGWDVMRAHPREIAVGTWPHVRHIALTPDNAYRASHDAYTAFVTKRVGDAMQRYLPANSTAHRRSPGMSVVANAYHRACERPLPEVTVSAYELMVLLSFVGGMVACVVRRREGAWILAMLVVYHIVGSGFMGGLEPRYVVPVQPLLVVWIGVLLTWLAGLRHARKQRIEPPHCRVMVDAATIPVAAAVGAGYDCSKCAGGT